MKVKIIEPGIDTHGNSVPLDKEINEFIKDKKVDSDEEK